MNEFQSIDRNRTAYYKATCVCIVKEHRKYVETYFLLDEKL